MQVEHERYQQMREYARVNTVLPVKVRRVPPAEQEAMRSGTSVESALANTQPLPEVEDERLSECLKIINSKLDTLIKLLTLQSNDVCSLKPAQVNVSAGGISMLLPEAYSKGEALEIKTMFPTIPYVVFTLYGVVLRSEVEAQGLWQTSVEFIAIDEDVRDRIAKFVFEKQREDLRKKRRQ